MYQKKLILLVMILVCISLLADAQTWTDHTRDFFRHKFLKKEYTEVGFQAGGAGYIGDMNNHVFSADNHSVLGFNSYSAGISAKHYFNPISAKDRTWGIRLDLNYNRLRGKDAWSSDTSKISRNLQFTNDVYEAALAGEFHFFDFRPNRMRSILSPYVFAGVGMIYHNPKAPHPDGSGKVSLIDEKVELRKISYEMDVAGNKMLDTLGNLKVTNSQKYRKVAAIIPFGAGIKLNGKGSLAPFAIGLELNYRYVFSDFLDGIGNREYHDYSVVNPRESDDAVYLNNWNSQRADWEQLAGPHLPTAKIANYQDLVNSGQKRGDSDKGNDSYMTAVLRVTYTFYKWRDPLWRNPNARRR